MMMTTAISPLGSESLATSNPCEWTCAVNSEVQAKRASVVKNRFMFVCLFSEVMKF